MNRLSDTLSWVGLFRLMSMIIILLVYFPTIHKKPRGDPQPAAYLENITKTCLIQGASCQLFHKFPSKKKHLILPKPGLPSHHLLIIRGISPFAHVNRDLAWLATDVQLKHDYVCWFWLFAGVVISRKWFENPTVQPSTEKLSGALCILLQNCLWAETNQIICSALTPHLNFICRNRH